MESGLVSGIKTLEIDSFTMSNDFGEVSVLCILET